MKKLIFLLALIVSSCTNPEEDIIEDTTTPKEICDGYYISVIGNVNDKALLDRWGSYLAFWSDDDYLRKMNFKYEAFYNKSSTICGSSRPSGDNPYYYRCNRATCRIMF